MKIILANGTELNPIVVSGSQKYINGMTRDALTFVFSEDASLDEINELFTDVNCETIKIYEGEGENESEYIHTGYVIRAELTKSPVVVKPATDETAEVVENRVSVSMALRTYTEKQLASLTETVDVLVMESLLGPVEVEDNEAIIEGELIVDDVIDEDKEIVEE